MLSIKPPAGGLSSVNPFPTTAGHIKRIRTLAKPTPLATAGLLRHAYGEWAEVAFCRRMDGCDDRHYFRDGALDLVLRDLAVGKPASPAKGTTGNRGG